jgi:hypothetical protein
LLEAMLDLSAQQETDPYTRDAAGRLMVLAGLSVEERYASAFRDWGLDVDGTEEAEVVARLRQEPDMVVQDLIAGLDVWMIERRSRGRQKADWQRLFRVAQQLDRSDRHRRLRALLVGGSPPRADSVAGLVRVGVPWPALWELARGHAWQRLREARKEINPRTEPVLSVLLLAQALAAVGDAAEAEQVLRQAVAARPGHVVLLATLGGLLERRPAQPRAPIESIAWDGDSCSKVV